MTRKITPDNALKLLFPSSKESEILFLATLNISVDLKNKNTAVRDKMFEKLDVEILGLIDNMSFFKGDDGKSYKIFGDGGVKRTAEEFGKEFLGEIPIDPIVGKAGDNGKPIVKEKPDHEVSKIYLGLAEKIKSAYL